MLRNPGIVYGLGNLVENAVDFAASTVSIRARWDDTVVALEIADDGPGFPAEVLARIGEPFVSRRPRRDREADARAKKGMGLGLFIAKTLLERTGAGVTIANAAGRAAPGALVTVAWPRGAAVLTAGDAAQNEGPRPALGMDSPPATARPVAPAEESVAPVAT